MKNTLTTTSLRRLLLTIFLAMPFMLFGQSSEETAGEPVPAPVEKTESGTAELDRIVQNLKSLQARNDKEREQFMKLHKTVSGGYASKGHYRQACEEYVSYLDLKEELFQKEHTSTVDKARLSVATRSEKLENDLLAAQEEAENAMDSVKRYDTFRVIYQQVFSIGLLVMTVLLSLSFVRSGVRMNSRKKETEEIRARLSGIQRAALAGRLSEGIRIARRVSLASLGEQTVEVGKKTGEGSAKLLEKLGNGLKETYRQN